MAQMGNLIFSYFQFGNMILFEPYAKKHYALYTLNLVLGDFKNVVPLHSISLEKPLYCYIKAFACQGVFLQTNPVVTLGEPAQALPL